MRVSVDRGRVIVSSYAEKVGKCLLPHPGSVISAAEQLRIYCDHLCLDNGSHQYLDIQSVDDGNERAQVRREG